MLSSEDYEIIRRSMNISRNFDEFTGKNCLSLAIEISYLVNLIIVVELFWMTTIEKSEMSTARRKIKWEKFRRVVSFVF